MDIKTLMIGDWVYDTLSQTNIKVNRGCFEINPLNGICYAENLIPIPLTTEILEKNGFVWDNLPISQCWEQYGLIIYPTGGGYRMNCGQNVSFKIDSVHELQHLFRLCGIEKEIEL